MKFIADAKSLNREFARLCEKYEKFYGAIAWAGDPNEFDAGRCLIKYTKKIERLVVGLHFSQTSPSFIKKFMREDSVRFIKQTDGTFHSKVYIFYNQSDSKWEAIVGSSNFTYSGFNRNYEANILMGSDTEKRATKDNLLHFVDKIWGLAEPINPKALKNYKGYYEKQKHLTKVLGHKINLNKALFTKYEMMTWEEFRHKITLHNSYLNRKRLLGKARELFESKKSFANLKLVDRKRIAGCPTESENERNNDSNPIDWCYFGSTYGYGIFTHAVIHGNKHLTKAIDIIPLDNKPITKKIYDKYCAEFLRALPNTNNPLALATRLLAIKRPDFFVCINGAVKKEICNHYGMPQSRLNLETYWQLLEQIHTDGWYCQDSKSNLTKYCTAMIDILYYNVDD